MAAGKAARMPAGEAPELPQGATAQRHSLAADAGQATVEFAIVAFGFLAATVALAAVWHATSGGMVAEHAAAVASHHIQLVAPATLADIFLY